MWAGSTPISVMWSPPASVIVLPWSGRMCTSRIEATDKADRSILSVPDLVDLWGVEAAERRADPGRRGEILGGPAGPEIDLVDGAVGSLQGRGGRGIRGDLVEVGVGLEVQRHAGLVQGSEPKVATTLD